MRLVDSHRAEVRVAMVAVTWCVLLASWEMDTAGHEGG